MNRVDQSADRRGASRLLIAGGRRLFCEGLEALFRHVPHGPAVRAIVGTKTSVMRAMGFRPHVVLLDFYLGEGTACMVAGAIRSRYPRLPLLLLDRTFHEGHLRAALKLGAGYLTQEDPFDVLLAAVRRAVRGRPAFCPEAETRIIRVDGRLKCRGSDAGSGLGRLTRRELQILVLLVQGLTVRQCGQQLHIAASTADNHKSHLMAKLGVHKAIDLVHVAIREGLLERAPACEVES